MDKDISIGNIDKTKGHNSCNFATLLECPVEKFNGQNTKIERFLAYIEAYKDVKKLSDEQSLRELPFLLEKHAFLWWQSKYPFKSWNDALLQMRKDFLVSRPAHEIYEQIFAKPFEENSEDLIKDLHEKIVLFALLPTPQPTEVMQLDMIYGMLPKTVQKCLQRSTINSLEQLTIEIKQLQNDEPNGLEVPQHMDHCYDGVALVQEVKVNNKRSNTNSNENERESFIKVRRTEDLMPPIKEEKPVEAEQTKANQAEFINETSPSLKNTSSCSSNNFTADFQIDNELMSQISHIIDNCELDISLQTADDVAAEQTAKQKTPQFSIAAVQSLQQPSMTIEINTGQSTICCTAQRDASAADIASILQNSLHRTSDTNSSNQSDTNQIKLRRRCALCNNKGHVAAECKRKNSKKVLLRQEKAMQRLKLKKLQTSSGVICLDDTPPPKTDTAEETPKSLETPNTLPISITAVTSSSIASSMSTKANNSSTSLANSCLTTKLISPGSVLPSSPKLTQVSKLRNEANTTSGSSLKCHQCGLVGYYRSICPNCSPIYFYKPPSAISR